MNVGASSANRLAFTQLEPIGVVVALSAFNHPLNLITHQVGAGGCGRLPGDREAGQGHAAVLLRFVEMLREAGLPDEWCIPLLPENNELSTKLATDPRVASSASSAAPRWAGSCARSWRPARAARWSTAAWRR